MAISFVGASAGSSGAPAVPAHVAGDVLYGWAWREASLTNPTVPADFNIISNTVDGVLQSISFGYKVATASGSTLGTWTNATQVGVSIYRGQNVLGRLTGAFVASAAAASSTTAVYGALTLTNPTGSWLLGFGAHRSPNTNINVAPTGMTARASSPGGGEIGLHDSAGIKTSWSAQTVALGGTANNWMTLVLELLAGTQYGAGHVPDAQVDATAKSNLNIHKVLELDYGQVKIVADSVYSASYGAVEGTAYPYSGTVEADVASDAAPLKTKDYAGKTETDVTANASQYRSISYIGKAEAEAAEDSVRAKTKVYSGGAEAEIAPSPSLARAKVYTGSVEACAVSLASAAKTVEWNLATSLTLTYGNIVSGSLDSTYTDDGVLLVLSEELGTPAFTYEFTFGEDQAVPTYNVFAHFHAWYDGPLHIVKLAQWNYNTSSYTDVTVNENDFPMSLVEKRYQFDLFHDPNYILNGQIKLRIQHESDGLIWHQFHLDYLHLGENAEIEYDGVVNATVSSECTSFKGKAYDGQVQSAVDGRGVYNSTVAHTWTYLGTVEAVSELSSQVAKGKAYVSDGRLIVEMASSPVFAYPTARSYSGSLLLTILPGASFSYSAGIGVVIPFRVKEAKPSDGYTLEPLPGRPAGQDGAYTEPGQDGAWDEYPVDGVYTDIGYFKEFKPFHRATMTKEGLPTRPGSVDGAYTESGQDGAWTEYPSQGAYTSTGYLKEFKPLRRATITKEGEPL